MNWQTTFSLLLIAFVVNVPLGLWRASLKKHSVSWLLAIHLSVPLLILLRIYWSVPWYVLPASITAAVAGQLVGERLRATRMERKQDLSGRR